MSTIKGTEEKNEGGAAEIKVKTVDYRSTPGKDNEPPIKENVEVIHRTDKDEDPGILANAVTAVRETLQSVKEATSKSGKNGK